MPTDPRRIEKYENAIRDTFRRARADTNWADAGSSLQLGKQLIVLVRAADPNNPNLAEFEAESAVLSSRVDDMMRQAAATSDAGKADHKKTPRKPKSKGSDAVM
jgi:hypothetical protein